MKTSKQLLDHEKLIKLFFVFVLGTISLWLSQLTIIPPFILGEGLRHALLLTGVFSYEVVIVALISYYLAKAKNKVAEAFEKDPQLYYKMIVSVLGITYLIIDTMIEKSVLVLIRDIIMVSLIFAGMPFVKKYFEKKKYDAPKKQTQTNGNMNDS